MSYGAAITRKVDLRRSRQKAHRRHRAENQRSFTRDEKFIEDKSLITDFSQVRKAIEKRKRRELIHTIIAITVAVAVVYLLSTIVDWHWLVRNYAG